MKIGLIGDGGREHALARRGICSGAKVDLYVAAKNKNDGIIRLAKDYLQRLAQSLVDGVHGRRPVPERVLRPVLLEPF